MKKTKRFYNPFYDCVMEIIVYTKEHINIASDLKQDWMDYIWTRDESRHAFDNAYAPLPLNQLHGKHILSIMAKDKLEWFFKERILGFIQILVIVSLNIFCRMNTLLNGRNVSNFFGRIKNVKQTASSLDFKKTELSFK